MGGGSVVVRTKQKKGMDGLAPIDGSLVRERGEEKVCERGDGTVEHVLVQHGKGEMQQIDQMEETPLLVAALPHVDRLSCYFES